MIGKTLGPYCVLEKLGEGGMGQVYRARDTRLDRDVAIKVLPPAVSGDPERRARFEREAKTIAGLNHPHICTLHDVGEYEASMFLVMELLEGQSLRAHLSQGRPAVPAIVEIGIQLADALESAHGDGIVHRDIKPENTFVTTRGTAKLLDFGIAKLVSEQTALNSPLTVTRVATGPLALGTIAYMSPEQIRGDRLDARTDLFSLGVVLYEMATGTQPFRGTTSGAILGEILSKAPTAPVQLNADIPSELERILNKLLEKDRDVRYQSAKDLRVDLERLRRNLSVRVTTSRAPAVAPTSAPSVAVLPFLNMSGDREQEYFSDGLSEEVINLLARIPGLRVIARTSAFAFKGKQQDARTIAQALGVGNILEGSVRRAGNRVRVSAQLVTASDGTQLWSDRFDRDLTDIFAIQDEISSAIARALQVALSGDPPASRRHALNPDAYESYLKALYQLWKLTPEALVRCREYLEHAIELAPHFALAHLGLAQHSWMLASMGYLPGHEAMPIVRTEARQALALDASLADAQAMLGVVAAAYDYDWDEAERRFRVAVSHHPGPSNAHSWFAYYCLLPTGRTREAVDHATRALAADPLNMSAHLMRGSCLNGDGNWMEAESEARHVLAIEENQMFACAILAVAAAGQEKWPAARAAAEAGVPRGTLLKGMLAGILRRLGHVQQADAIVRDLMTGQSYDAPLGLAWHDGMAGKLDTSAEWFRTVAERRHPDAAHHSFLALRTLSQWSALAKVMHLPDNPDVNRRTAGGHAVDASAAIPDDIDRERRSQSAREVRVDSERLQHTLTEPRFFPGRQDASLVVLPFTNLSPDPDNAFFTEGLTEEIITDLSRLHALRVISRGSAMQLKNTTKDARTIGRELNVRYVLGGSVRRAGNQLRVAAQLVEAEPDAHVWAEKYTGTLDDVFEIQEKMSRTIVDALKVRLTADEERLLAARHLPDAQAFDTFLQARQALYVGEPGALERAESLVRQAVTRSGPNAWLYALLAQLHFQSFDSLDRDDPGEAQIWADAALELSPDCARALLVKALLAYKTGDMGAAIRFGRRAVRTVAAGDAFMWLSYMCLLGGRMDEGREAADAAIACDPLAWEAQFAQAIVALFEGDHQRAVGRMRAIAEALPGQPSVSFWLGMSLRYAGRRDEAISALDQMAQAGGSGAWTDWATALAASTRDERAAAASALSSPVVLKLADLHPEAAWSVADAFARIGKVDSALYFLGRAIDLGVWNHRFWSEVNPAFAPVRTDPRFLAAIEHAKEKEREIS